MKVFAFGFFLLCLFLNVEGGLVDRESYGNPTSVEGEDHDQSLELFKEFVKKYNRVYSDEHEFNRRLSIFRDNLKKIEILKEKERGTASYGVTKFSDWTSDEMKKSLGYRKTDSERKVTMVDIPKNIPDEFDWRDHHAVTGVKDQKNCGSSWAFSVVANVEGQWAINKKELLSLSEQELLDCDKKDNACRGGHMEKAMDQIVALGGLELESEYPYEAKEDVCRLNKTEIRAKISKQIRLPSDEDAIKAWVYKNGPVSAAINADAMYHYKNGISHPGFFSCLPPLNHAVLIVGYGVDKSNGTNTPYWIIKNSWGSKWGENGYYRLYRGDDSCGIADEVISALL